MTARDFRAIADIIARFQGLTVEESLARAFADMLAQTNPRFDRSRFLAAAMGSPATNGDKPRDRDYR